ncbi:lebercilin LCA5 like [Phyllostomus discolor]|nr:lebercilin LCA5 like [Phyllostomus discolor]
MEENDQKLQNLEKQLRLKTKAFGRQLATETQKTLVAQAAKEALHKEVRRLQQKLKEKDRELEIRNIYANRILKNLHDTEDYPKVSSTKSVQADRTGAPATSVRHQETQKSEDAPTWMTKSKKTTGNAGHREKPTETVRAIPRYSSKLPGQEGSERKHEGHQRDQVSSRPAGDQCHNPDEGRGMRAGLQAAEVGNKHSTSLQTLTWLSKDEEHSRAQAAPENTGRQREKKADQEKQIPLEKEQEPPPETAQVTHLERGGQQGDEAAKEGLPKSLQTSEADEVPNKTVAPNMKTLLRQRKRYSFTVATENLHHGLPASGGPAPGPRRCNPGPDRRRGAREGPRPEHSASVYEPSFGKSSRTKAAGAAFRDKKSSLMRELFGSGYVFKKEQASAAREGPEETWKSTKVPQPPPGQTPASNGFGDSKVTVVNSIKSSSPTEGKIKIII